MAILKSGMPPIALKINLIFKIGTYHEEVAAVSGEDKVKKADGGVSLEASGYFFTWVPEEVHLRVQAILCRSNEPSVVVRGRQAVPIALRPIQALVKPCLKKKKVKIFLGLSLSSPTVRVVFVLTRCILSFQWRNSI
jgi:hypothetical protein